MMLFFFQRSAILLAYLFSHCIMHSPTQRVSAFGWMHCSIYVDLFMLYCIINAFMHILTDHKKISQQENVIMFAELSQLMLRPMQTAKDQLDCEAFRKNSIVSEAVIFSKS